MTEPTRTRTDRAAYVLAQVATVLAVAVGLACTVSVPGQVGPTMDGGLAVALTAVVLLGGGVALARVSPARLVLLHVVPALLLTRWWWGRDDVTWFAWTSAGEVPGTLVLDAVDVAVPVLLVVLWTLAALGVVTHARRTPAAA